MRARLAALLLALAPAAPALAAEAPAATATERAPRARWWDEVRERWVAESLPPSLRAPGPKGLAVWQWIALPLLLAFALAAGRGLSWLSRALLRPVARRTAWEWDDALLDRLAGPAALLWALAVAWALLPALGLTAAATELLRGGFRAGALVAFFWGLLRSVDMAGALASRSTWAKARPSALAVVPLGVRIAKVAIVPVAVVAVLADLGYPVASLLAGLGVGGLALALAAQKTVENLFGSLSIGVDQPFRVGDFVRIEDTTLGTVEQVGLRSTQIRTLDRTVISLPNGKLADLKIETFAPRDRYRLHTVIGLVYSTKAAQVRAIAAELESILRAHPGVFPEGAIVTLQGFGASSLDVEVQAWFVAKDFDEFRRLRQEVLLQLLEAVERGGSALAFPTRTVHLAGDVTPPAAGGR